MATTAARDVTSIRLSAAERALLDLAAREKGVVRSQLIRYAALREAALLEIARLGEDRGVVIDSPNRS